MSVGEHVEPIVVERSLLGPVHEVDEVADVVDRRPCGPPGCRCRSPPGTPAPRPGSGPGRGSVWLNRATVSSRPRRPHRPAPTTRAARGRSVDDSEPTSVRAAAMTGSMTSEATDEVASAQQGRAAEHADDQRGPVGGPAGEQHDRPARAGRRRARWLVVSNVGARHSMTWLEQLLAPEQLDREEEHPGPERARRRRAACRAPPSAGRSSSAVRRARRRGAGPTAATTSSTMPERERAVRVDPHPADREQPAADRGAPPWPGKQERQADQPDHEGPLRPEPGPDGEEDADQEEPDHHAVGRPQERPRQPGQDRRHDAPTSTRTPSRPPSCSAVA